MPFQTHPSLVMQCSMIRPLAHVLRRCLCLLVLIGTVNGVSLGDASIEAEPVEAGSTFNTPKLGFLGTGAEQQRESTIPVDQTIDDSLKKATKAAEQAWALSKQVEVKAGEVLAAGNSVAAEIALAKSAAETAKKEDEKATALFYKTRTSAIQAAVFAARAYYDQVRAAGAAADARKEQELKQAADQAEVNAAKAAAAAAMPYHAQLLRGQKVVVDYMRKAQALAAAAVNLKKEGFKLAQSAEAYQQNAQLAEASQIMMQAHSLMSQGEAYEAQAAKLSSTANDLNGALPALQMAGQAAAESAAMTANPLTKDYLSPYHPY
mmetsp:Transcript_38345/g.61474  ORF Transcript_38345/g.61474 Transcript_38345/m.61474 type:complete len:321 (-) Transcript_38345:92-1054(-)